MAISAFATDYDGTLATLGRVDRTTLSALERLKASGRRLLMVTGREIPDLRSVFPAIELFDAIVAENGALLYRPDLDEESALGPPPPQALVEELQRRRLEPLAVGRSIVATARENEAVVVAALEALQLPWRIIRNKDSVMVLADGVDKASGLVASLLPFGLGPPDVLGVGDAENDAPFLAACGVSAAVANGLPSLKAQVDVVTASAAGAGVTWLIGQLLEGALDQLAAERQRAGVIAPRAAAGSA